MPILPNSTSVLSAKPVFPATATRTAYEPDPATWRRIFKLRNAVAFRWFSRMNGRVPVEEFMSMSNLVITEVLQHFQPEHASGSGLYHVLFLAMHRRMPSVVRAWLHQIVEDGARRYHAAEFVEFAPTHHHTSDASLEACADVAACLRCLRAYHFPPHAEIFVESLDGSTPTEQAAVHHKHPNKITNIKAQVRAHVRAWAASVETAADERSA